MLTTGGGDSRGQESSAALTCWPLRALLPARQGPLPRRLALPQPQHSPSLPASPFAPHPAACRWGPQTREQRRTAGVLEARPSPGPADLVPVTASCRGRPRTPTCLSPTRVYRTQDSRGLGTRPGPVPSAGLEASPALPTLITVQALPAPEGPPPPQSLPGGLPKPLSACTAGSCGVGGETTIAPASPTCGALGGLPKAQGRVPAPQLGAQRGSGGVWGGPGE